MKKVIALLPVLLCLPGLRFPVHAATVTIGSKKFTESYVLGEIARRTLENAGLSVAHHQGMGGTIILWQALRGGQIDAYPEYTGTIAEEILKIKPPPGAPAPSEATLRAALARQGIGMTADLGFNNTYALAMRSNRAAQLGIGTISDLRAHPELVAGLSHEFLGRADGWAPLCRRYRLQLHDVRGVEHALGYAALSRGSIDLVDAYSTDAKIVQNHLVVLRDDLGFFPAYKAVFLYRLAAPPAAIAALCGLAGKIDERTMTALNAAAEESADYTYAASLYFAGAFGPAPGKAGAATPGTAATDAATVRARARADASARETSLAVREWGWTLRHLFLVGSALLLSILAGVPLGIRASRPGAMGGFILGAVGVLQTIPSLALMALLVPIPHLGISPLTAIVALFLYGLLPIVRNTATGLQEISPALRESAAALGLRPPAQMRLVFLPLAARTILAGIKTSAVISVGTATIAALIGAGGLGEPILSGLNLNDNATIMQGAIPAALLALLVQAAFEGLDRLLIPRGLAAERPRRH